MFSNANGNWLMSNQNMKLLIGFNCVQKPVTGFKMIDMIILTYGNYLKI